MVNSMNAKCSTPHQHPIHRHSIRRNPSSAQRKPSQPVALGEYKSQQNEFQKRRKILLSKNKAEQNRERKKIKEQTIMRPTCQTPLKHFIHNHFRIFSRRLDTKEEAKKRISSRNNTDSRVNGNTIWMLMFWCAFNEIIILINQSMCECVCVCVLQQLLSTDCIIIDLCIVALLSSSTLFARQHSGFACLLSTCRLALAQTNNQSTG